MKDEKDLPKVLEGDNSSMLVFGSQSNFEQAIRMARCLCASSIVPAIYQDPDKGLSNCIIALEMANRIKMSPLMVMQNLYIVYGNIGWSSKFLIAAWNTCGKYTTIKYEFEGDKATDNFGCRAISTDKETGDILRSALVTIKMAKVEGWFDKKGSKWQTMPELMLQYRAAAFLVRTYAPEISMGMQTEEELHDIIDVEFNDVTEHKVAQKVTTEANATPLPPEDTKPVDASKEEVKPKAEPVKPNIAEQPVAEQPVPPLFSQE